MSVTNYDLENDDFKNLNYDDLFDPTKKIEPAQESVDNKFVRMITGV